MPAIDAKEEANKFKAMMVVGLIFLVAGFKSCGELRYTMSGITTVGRVAKVYDVYEGRRARDRYAVDYTFKDEEGKRHRGSIEMLADDALALEGAEVEVIYLSGNPETSTLTDHRSVLWPIVFLTMSAFFALSIYRVVKT